MSSEESSKRVLRRRSQENVTHVLPRVKKQLKPILTVEDIYLQKDFEPSCFIGTSLETIYECPKSRKNGNPLMGSKKIRRQFNFTPYNPPKHKVTKRVSRAMMLIKKRNPAAKKLSSCKINDYSDVEYENVPSRKGTITVLNDVDCNPMTSSETDVNMNSMDTTISSSLLISNDKTSDSKENSINSDLSKIESDLDDFLLFRSKKHIKKNRRSSQQFSSIAFKDVCKSTSNDCTAKRKSNNILEDSECSLDSENAIKRFHSLGSNRNRFSGIYGNVSLDYLENKDLPAMEVSSTDSKFSPDINTDCIESKEVTYTELHLTNMHTCANSCNNKSCTSEICKDGLDSSSEVDPVSNCPLSPILLCKLSLGTPKKRITNRRRSARLSIQDCKSNSTFGSLWLDP